MRQADESPQLYRIPAWLKAACAAGVVIGVAALIVTFAVAPADGWAWLIVNFVFFTGIANGVLAWAFIFRTAQTRWTASINRLAQASIAYVPIMAITLIVLLAGIREWATWIRHPYPAIAAWLNIPFTVARDVVALGAFWILGILLVRRTLAADAKISRGADLTKPEEHRINALAVAGVLTYSVITTIVAYDFIMSLWPSWYSTVFGPYIFCTNVYAGIAVLILLSAALRGPLGVTRYIGPKQFQDMGNLMLGFGLFNMGLFYAQYLTIWYENLPQETDFLIIRYLHGGWPYLGWAAFFAAYAIPFVILQSRHLKQHPRMLAPVAVLAIAGVALERYVLVVPSLRPDTLMLFPAGILISLAYLAAFVMAVAVFLSRYRPVSETNLALASEPEEAAT